MNAKFFHVSAVFLFGSVAAAGASAAQQTASPAILASMPLTVDSGPTVKAPSLTTPAPVAATPTTVAPANAHAPVTGDSSDRARAVVSSKAADDEVPDTPTVGDWDNLAQRKAYAAELKKLKPADSKEQQAPSPLPQLGALPPLPPPLPAGSVQKEAKKKERFSPSCPDDGKPCFFSVYGMSIEGVGNNYKGLLAIDGRVVPVHKGATFGRYTVADISTHELTAVDRAGKKYVWPYAGDADFSADPEKIDSTKQSANGSNGGNGQFTNFIPLGGPGR
jgi:hypothetical protein